jgi:thioredoxin-dependent peroxiredoxin
MRASVLMLLTVALAGPVVLSAQTARRQPTAVLSGGPEAGRVAPDFTLPWANKDGVGPVESHYQLWRDRGKVVVIAFYPRDFTPTCTAQFRSFADQQANLFGPDVVVVGVSSDPVESHSRFAASLGLPFRLLSDPEQLVARKYGSYDGSGYPRRTVYVVGADGKVKYRNMHFDPANPEHLSRLGSAVGTARGG